MNRRRLYDPIPEGPFSRIRIARLTGLSAEVVAHWTKEGILVPSNDATGAGQHKEFDYIEVGKAAVLGYMRDFGCGIEAFRWFAQIIDRGRLLGSLTPLYPSHWLWHLAGPMRNYRRMLAGERVMVTDSFGGSFDKIPARTIDDCIAEELWEWHKNDNIEERRAILRDLVLKHHSELDETACRIMPDLTVGRFTRTNTDAVYVLWRKGGEWKIWDSPERGNLSGLTEESRASLLIYVTQVMRDLWSVDSLHLDDSPEYVVE